VTTESIQRIPVTILTGFLGAGKTTLLNRLLHTRERRFAVLVNDFGSINIDSELIVSVEGETISLAGGCVCCRIRGDLLEAATALAARPEPPEHILVETSGVASPWPVAETFTEAGARRAFVLDGIITVADAEQVRDQPEHLRLIQDQFRAADIIVLNKCDRTTPAQRTDLHAWIGAIAPDARIIEAVEGRVPPALLLGRRDPEAGADLLPPHDELPPADAAFASWSYRSELLLGRTRVWQALNDLPHGVIRAKGVFHFGEAPGYRTILQMVGRRVQVYRGEPWGDQPPTNQLVAIGTPGVIANDELQARLDACSYRTPVEEVCAVLHTGIAGLRRRLFNR
jgi:G3E family GTPase